MEMVQNLIRNLSAAEKLQFYSYHTKPVLNFQALFTDGSSNYMNPVEPKTGDEVTVRFRTARENAEHVFLCVNGEKKEMQIASKTERFDFYESSFFMGTEIADYYFEIHSGGTCCYFNKKGPARDLEPFFNYKVTPGFSTPDWAKGAIFYQIYVDRFANGDTSNDVLNREYIYINQPSKKIDDWYRYPEEMDVRNFYGGDLQGVLDHLDYLKGLGVDVIYLNPIFVSPSNHKYDIQDYDYIDPHYGKIVVDEGNTLPDWENNNMNASKYISRVTDKRNLEASNEFFIHFVEEVHKKGMRVILDGVFNHCGSFNKWMDAERIYENQYGYEKGAFTDARKPKAGRMEVATGGTLFLDEIGNLSLPMQAKLLTAIEKRQISRLGSTQSVSIDVRLICATNADILNWVEEGNFRQDLLYRINTIELHIPPLRERGNDIILLADYFLQRYARKYQKEMRGLTREAKAKLLRYSWPGNVRELQHTMERAVILGDGSLLRPDNFLFQASSPRLKKEEEVLNLEQLERQAVEKAMRLSEGNMTRAAEYLGITRFALYRKIEKLGL